jgi:ectoine hydroxylase-related dioxygenase (phytanoyl-CoA dioxygenase family)
MGLDESYPLSRTQTAFYQENGYIHLPGVMAMDEVRNLRKILARAVRERKRKYAQGRIQVDARYEKVFVQMVNLWEDYEEIRPFIFSHRLAEIARRLTRSRSIRLWHDHALIKPALDGAQTPWHQDFPYWPMNEPGALSCWLALDNVDETNGCMSFIPGTHKLGPLDPISLTNPRSVFRTAGLDKRKAQTAVMRLSAGSCTFHDGNTFHYAGPNHSAHPRRALAIIYMPPGTTYNGNPHCVTEGIGLKVGQILRGPKFPVLAGK